MIKKRISLKKYNTMKKLFIIFLITASCLSLCYCAKKPTVTPNEPEVVTPDEPEVEEPEKDVIMLPEADENTKYITIEFPEDFPEEPYTEPNLVSPEDFDWGEYVPFVKYYDHINSLRNEPLFNYAFLGENIGSLEDGWKLYDKFNTIFETFFEIGTNSFDAENVSDFEYIEYSKHFSNGRVTSMSEDIDRVNIFYSKFMGSETVTDLQFSNWKSYYTVYKNGTPTFSYESPEYILGSPISPEAIEVEFFSTNFKENVSYATKLQNCECVYLSDDYAVFENALDKHYYIYSLKDNKMLYDIEYPSDTYMYSFTENRILYELDEPYYSDDTDIVRIHQSLHIEDIIEGKYILFTAKKLYSKYKFYNYSEDYYSKTYLYNVEKNELIFLEDYAFTPKMSSDGKLLAYTNSNHEHTLDEQPQGFYVRNLSDGTTVFYPTPFDDGSVWFRVTEVKGFVKKEALYNLIQLK